jgi:peptidyl-prolyl cis-trans isomerase D
MKTFFAANSSETQYYDGYISKQEIKHKFIDSIVKVGVGNIYGPYVDGGDYVLAKIVGEKQIPDSVKIRHILVATHQQDPQTGALMRVKEDSVARKIMDTVEAEIKAGKSFDSVCLKYSDDGTKTSGGVYDYFPSGRMVPEFNDFAFGNGTGAKGVVKTDYGYHYIEILGQKGSGTAYKIAYLSRPIVVSSETDNAASTAATQFASTSRNRKDFEVNAAKIKKYPFPSGDLKENDFIISGLNSSARQVVRWLYEHNTGDVADQIFRVGEKYIVPMVTSVIKPGLPPAAVLRPQIEPIVRNEKKAKQIIATKIKGNTLEAVASSTGTTVQKTDSVLFNSPFISGLGMEPKFTGAAFNTTLKGKVSDPIAGNSAVFVLRVENISSKPATADPDAIKSTIMQSQQMSIYRGTEGLKKASRIKDYRSKFY